MQPPPPEKGSSASELANPFFAKDILQGGQVRKGVIRYNIKGTIFDIPARYSPIKLIGQGAYGIVW